MPPFLENLSALPCWPYTTNLSVFLSPLTQWYKKWSDVYDPVTWPRYPFKSVHVRMKGSSAWFTSAPIWMTDLNSNGSIIESNHLLNLFNWLSWPYLPGPLSSLGTRFRKLFSVCAKPGIRAVWWKSGMITKQFLSSYSRPVNSMVILDYTLKPPSGIVLSQKKIHFMLKRITSSESHLPWQKLNFLAPNLR